LGPVAFVNVAYTPQAIGVLTSLFFTAFFESSLFNVYSMQNKEEKKKPIFIPKLSQYVISNISDMNFDPNPKRFCFFCLIIVSLYRSKKWIIFSVSLTV